MNRLSDEGETVSVCVKMPRAMRDALDRQVEEHGFANRSEAARTALEAGLNGKPSKVKRAQPKAAGGCRHPETRRIGTGCGECGEDPV